MAYKRLIIVALFLASSATYAQNNLVLNPGFEDYTSCPTANDQTNKAKYWSSIDSTVQYRFGYSCYPDFCHKCVDYSKDSFNSIPQSTSYWQYPHSGAGMMQSLFYVDETNWGGDLISIRDYVQGRLYKKLTAGKRYCVAFYVNLEEVSDYAIMDISAYLDNGTIDTAAYCGHVQTQCNPQVTNSGGIITDTLNWTKIQGSFVAKGTECFITIGNFRDSANTIKASVVHSSRYISEADAFYLIDDVSVIPSDLPANAGPDKHVGKGDSIYIGQPQEVGLESNWTELGSNTVIGIGAGIWVKPSVTTKYVVTQTLCGNTSRDTMELQVWPLGLQSIKGQTQDYTLAPNPSHGQVNLLQNVRNDEEIQVAVYNLVGQEVYRGSLVFANGQAELQLPELAKGIYFLRLQNKKGTVWNKRLVRE